MDLKKLLEKKKGGAPMDDNYKAAKMSTLQALRGEMADMMKGDLQKPGLKKVTVASDKPEGLAEGLDKAKELIGGEEGAPDADSNGEEGGLFGAEEAMESPEEEASESPEEESAEGHSSLSPEEETMLALLMKKAGK